MSVSLALIHQLALKPPQLARKAISNPRLLPDIMDGLNAAQARIKYGCAKALCQISELQPEVLYPHFDFCVRLLDHENKILQWNGAYMLSQLIRVDAQDKFSAVFEKYFAPIPGPYMITAANVIAGGARIAQARPDLADRIGIEILKVGRARYQTAECRNVAIGHAIIALGDILPLLRNPTPAIRFVRRQVRNSRPATRKKAERFLKSRQRAVATSR
jgi:hypothetical protein